MSDVTPKKTQAQLAKATPDPVEEAAAAIIEEVISKNVVDLVMNAKESDLRGPEDVREVAKGNTTLAHDWVTGPATHKFSALSYRRIIKVGEWLGMKNKEINKIQAKFIGDSKVLLLRPAPDSDRTAYDLHRYQGMSGAWCNLFELMGSHGVTVETGYRERFDVVYVPKQSPLWPGLLIDLGAPKERRPVSQKKKNAEANATTAQAKKTTEQAPAKPTTSTETSA